MTAQHEIDEKNFREALAALRSVILEKYDEDQTQQLATRLLDSAYSLTQFWSKQNPGRYKEFLRDDPAGPVPRGLEFLRGSGVHDSLLRGEFGDTYGDTYTNVYGTWTWADAADAREGLFLDNRAAYKAAISGKEVLSTLPVLEQAILNDLPKYATQVQS